MPTVHFNAILSKRGAEPDIKLGAPGSGITPKTSGTVPSANADLDHCDTQITPVCLRALYNIKYKPTRGATNSYGIGARELVSCMTDMLISFFFDVHSGIYPSGIPAVRFKQVLLYILPDSSRNFACTGLHRRRCVISPCTAGPIHHLMVMWQVLSKPLSKVSVTMVNLI